MRINLQEPSTFTIYSEPLSLVFVSIRTTEKTEEGTAFGLKIRSFVPQFVVFLYTIYLQWSIAFALVLVFFLDWFAVSQHLSCGCFFFFMIVIIK